VVDRRESDRDDGPEQALWLSELLDAAADEYEPDTERLKGLVSARIAQQSEESDVTSALPTRRARKPRRRRGLGLIGRLGLAGIPAGVALSTIGAAAAIAVGATATIAVTSSHDHHTVTVAGPSTSPETATTDTAAGASPTSSAGESASSAATGESTHPATSGAGAATGSTSSSSGLVGATASIDRASNTSWSQLDLVVAVNEPVTALHVTVKVSKCAGLASTGSFDTVGSQFTEVTTTGSDGSITYEFDLVKGATLAPGSFTFAAQFQHATSGWKQQDDTYYVSARTASSTSASVADGTY
jgi:hypothetical protein